jgi:hypothetical protein
MQLSPFNQYYLQKLLRDYVNHFNPVLARGYNSETSPPINLNQILFSLYPHQSQRQEKLKDVELLIKFCQQIEKSKSRNQSHSNHIKQQIFRLLGLHYSSIVLDHALDSRGQHSIYRCCYHIHPKQSPASLQRDNHGYQLADRVQPTPRWYAYQFAWTLAKQKFPLILTGSEGRHVVWAKLRSPTYAVLSMQNPRLLRMVLPLYSTLTKFRTLPVKQVPKVA